MVGGAGSTTSQQTSTGTNSRHYIYNLLDESLFDRLLGSQFGGGYGDY